jgi:hypothetical protein
METFVAEWKVIKALLETQKQRFNNDPALDETADGKAIRQNLRQRVGRMINQIDQLVGAYDA